MESSKISNEIADISKIIKTLLDNEFEVMIENILIQNPSEFVESLTSKVFNSLSHIPKVSKSEISKSAKFLYDSNFKFLYGEYNMYKRMKSSLDSDPLPIKFTPHCGPSCKDNLLHACKERLIGLNLNKRTKTITNLICMTCKKCYSANNVKSYCSVCKTQYHTALLDEKSNKKIIFNVTWKNYHCNILINEKMKCIKCTTPYILNLNSNLLFCSKCDTEVKAKSLVWKCKVCKSDFQSEVKIYNPIEFDSIKATINRILLVKKPAIIDRLKLLTEEEKYQIFFPCCKNEYTPQNNTSDSMKLIHKESCKGELFEGMHDDKMMIVCSTCKSLNLKEKFVWTCPFCFQNFRSEEMGVKKLRQIKSNGLSDSFHSEEKNPQRNVLLNGGFRKRRTLNEILSQRESGSKCESSKNLFETALARSRNEYNSSFFAENSFSGQMFGSNGGNNERKSLAVNNPLKKSSSLYLDKENGLELNRRISLNHVFKPVPTVNKTSIPLPEHLRPYVTMNVDEYTIIEQIGEGSWGKIYSIEKNGKTYAMKKIIAHDLSELEAFLSEIYLIKSLPHTNIMKICGTCVRALDSTIFALYVIMEKAMYDWSQEIKERSKKPIKHYTEEELIGIIKALTRGLKFLQKNNISHRDIKPQNVLVFDSQEDKYYGQSKVYKVADFGEAKVVKLGRKDKDVNTLRGTEMYMSPILFEGNKVNLEDVSHNPYKSDVFSLGLCLLYAATFSASSLDQLREKMESKDFGSIPGFLNKLLQNLYSNNLNTLILKMIAYDESDRFDFKDLDSYLTDTF
jgi:hypothetical protein